MVVLEGGGGMLSSASNQYLQPDYLSPLPTTLDAKKSPLALLAQTCSQIGADSPSTKALLPPLEKKKSHGSSGSSGAESAGSRAGASPSAGSGHKGDRTPVTRTTPPSEPNKLAFKPYETNVLSKKEDRPSSKASNEDGRKSASEVRAPSRKSPPAPLEKSSSAPPADREKSVSPPQDTSPIIRSGLEILQGHPKDMPLGTYKPPSLAGLQGLSALCSGCPPGLDPSNPAFRPAFAGGPFSHHHAALLAAGYPAAPGPYVSYARVKTAAGGEALVPVCKDPYCTGCQFSMHSNMLLGAGTCPSGCTQCDHQKYGLAAAALGMLPPGLPPSLSPYTRPYVCSWMIGEAYCGKRFTTPDELLQHLRTHTNPSASDPASSTAMSSLYSTAALHRAAAVGYPNPPLSPLSAAARYHPYSKPPSLPGALGASPFSAFNPTSLGPYYSPYSVYGQRIGAAVHP